MLSFGLADRVDLLERFVSSGAAWCGTVSSECADQAEKHGLPELWGQATGIFGDPWLPTGGEHQDIQVLRNWMLNPGDEGAHPHLGEAETITIASAVRFSRAWDGRTPAFVTDDRDARKRAKSAGLVSLGTWDVLAMLVKSRNASFEECVEAGERMVKAGRARPHDVNGRPTTDVRAWLRRSTA